MRKNLLEPEATYGLYNPWEFKSIVKFKIYHTHRKKQA